MTMATDEVLREGVRTNLVEWIKTLNCNGDTEKQWFFKNRFINKLKQSPIAADTSVEKANEQHYEVPTEVFKTVLGKRLKYSGCYWPDGVNSLEEAEEESLRQYCTRARIEDGQTVLDLGCGWGSMSLWLLEKYPNMKVVSLSNSATQREFIQAEAARKGYSSRSECITADATTFNTDQRFDRIIVIEMLEHMRNYDILLSRISGWLKPHGLLFIQTFAHKEVPYAFDTKQGSHTEWMAKNFFTGGIMPSADIFLYFQNDIVFVDHWRINGTHYTKTLETWLQRLDENKAKVEKIMKEAYGEKDAAKQLFNWRLFFIFCAETFGYGQGNEWIVAHSLFKKRQSNKL